MHGPDRMPLERPMLLTVTTVTLTRSNTEGPGPNSVLIDPLRFPHNPSCPGSQPPTPPPTPSPAPSLPPKTVVFVRSQLATSIVPVELQCEYQANPIGIGNTKPRLGWKLAAVSPQARNLLQTGYRIEVTDHESGVVVWDTGRVLSNESVAIEYDGKPMQSRQSLVWRLMVWDQHDAPSSWSNTAAWEMALLAAGDWAPATWLGRYNNRSSSCAYHSDLTPRFRTEFTTSPGLKQARMYVAGLGYYQLALDGVRVGDRYLDPGWTSYKKRVRCAFFDRHLYSRMLLVSHTCSLEVLPCVCPIEFLSGDHFRTGSHCKLRANTEG
jgi:hypothetical protein